MTGFITLPPESKLDVFSLAEGLTRAGRLSAKHLAHLRGRVGLALHPLVWLAEQKLPDVANPGQVLDMDALLEFVGEDTGQEVVEIDPLKVDVAAVSEVMSEAFAKRHQILAVAVDADELVVASAEPFVQAWERDLEHVVRRSIRRVLADPREIHRLTAEFYSMAGSVRGARGITGLESDGDVTNLEAMLDIGGKGEPDANDQHIVSVVDWLLQYAFEQRASDIHIEPRRAVSNVRLRIDGVLHKVYELPAAVGAAVTSRFKILARLDVAEKRRPQDGRIKTRTPDRSEVELRLSTLPTAFGEKLVMRIFDPDVLLKSFSALGLCDSDLARWEHMISTGTGIVLVTGPTGSGKTTTLYSTLRRLAVPEVNVCTIEDPIEMVEPTFNQMQVNHQIDLDFASGVRALMRQDPDIIMVGEIRDLETAHMAVQAALTGHLVLTTLHTNDSPGAISRLNELGVPAFLLRATVRGVMSQRLVRKLCAHCKQEQPVEIEGWKELVADALPAPERLFRPTGCKRCRDTGYFGREGIYEVLVSDDELQSRITEGHSTAEIRHAAIKGGMVPLRLAGAQKVLRGETTVEEVLRVAPAVEF
ncbi:type II secretion system protein E [Luminiphilus syltensis NOR5-1B]|uniref:Type II secretion system protein E n=1 Tax=Luminiphilus syltensis NOR5-1B TaxID=565045 RepID=B8KUK6_9GAMM|nr:GspE/PulE family protein [Luminiphilus syltensis]EED36970.1 type II secretion system protein E [Luminiphilus syltensis NOR5-1B]